MGVERWLTSLRVNFAATLPMQKRSCGSSFGCSKVSTVTFAAKFQLENLSRTLPATIASWLLNSMVGNITRRKALLMIGREPMNCRNTDIVSSDFGMPIFLKILKVPLI